jgi:threonyl-tRNA synthetase
MSTEAGHLDHRDLHVFAADPLAGAGLPLWLPDGAVVREERQNLARDLARADGCQGVYSPVLGKRALYERSGHWAKFSDDMCPHHALIYAAARHSYRELPVRLSELAAMFRAERSGVLSGPGRVRQANLDDTHVFCRPDQVADEAARGLRAALRAQQVLGLPVDYVRLSLRDERPAYLGGRAQWQAAEAALRRRPRLPLWLAPVQVCVLPSAPARTRRPAGSRTRCPPRDCGPGWTAPGHWARASPAAASAGTASSPSPARPRRRPAPPR